MRGATRGIRRTAHPTVRRYKVWGAGILAMTACVLVLVAGLPPRGQADGADPTALRAVAPDVYESYLKGLLQLERGDRTRVEQSVRYLEATIAADRTFAPAYAQLAVAYQTLGSTATGARPVAEVQPRAAELARKALDLDPHLPAAHSGVASAFQQEWRWAEAEAAYRRALELDAQDPTTHARLAGLLTWRGRVGEGLAHARRAREIDPLNMDRTVHLGWLLYHARRYDEAIREFQTVLDVEPDHPSALWFRGFALIESSRLDEAVETLEHLVHVWERNPAALGLLARAYGSAGRRAEARDIVSELQTRQRAGYVPPAPFVHAYIGLGDRENAFAALERAYRERSNIVQFLKTHPLYDSLRDDPRFTQLLHRVGLD
jgi:tetratricopeptide (TPR) repeat protein